MKVLKRSTLTSHVPHGKSLKVPRTLPRWKETDWRGPGLTVRTQESDQGWTHETRDGERGMKG